MSLRDVADIYRLTPMQEGMLFHSLSDPDLGLYVEQATCVLESALDPSHLREAWGRVVAHHPALRSSFHWREVDRPVQVVRRSVDVPWREEDWRDRPAVADPAAERARFEALVEADRRRGFDLQRAPLLRVTLVRTGERRWRFLWTYHHLLLDGWSLMPVLQHVFEAYSALREGRRPALPPATAYVEYVTWLGERSREPHRSRTEAFWRRALAGFAAPTPLPGGAGGDFRSGPGRDRAARGSLSTRPASVRRTLTLAPADASAFRGLCRRAEVTPGTVVQASWALLLGRWSGEDDVVFGSVVSGRPPHLEGSSSMVGLFINTLPVRVRIAEDEEVVPWLQRLQARLVELRDHEHSSLAEVQRWSELPPGRPLFESLVAFENYPRDPALLGGLPGLEVRELESLEQTNYALNLAVLPEEEALRLELTYDPEGVDPASGDRLLAGLATLLRNLAAAPGGRLESLSLLSPDEEWQVLVSWNATGSPPADGGAATLDALVAEQVARTPDAVAVAPPAGAAWTYRELWTAAGAVARRLASRSDRGSAPGPSSGERLVGVLLERTPEAFAALVGVLRAGAAYLPLDPDLPDRRLLGILADARPARVVTRRALWDRLGGRTSAEAVFVDGLDPDAGAASGPSPGDPDDPGRAAYVIYTSGSTGVPKGVIVSHRSVVSFLRAARDHLAVDSGSRIAQVASLGFDASVAEVFLPLISGGRVCPVDRETLLSPAALERALERSGTNVLLATPGLADALSPERCPGLEQVVVGGDRCPPQVAARWSSGRRFANNYGPTEATIYCVRHEGPGGPKGPPIGRPIANARAYVLDRRLRPVPPGAAGEVLLGGLPLARGYWNRPGLTADRFVPHPFGHLDGRWGERLYRTGDLGRFLPDGEIELSGRLDHQVKVRGHRVECGEVEAVLRDHRGVAACAVVARDVAPHRRLAAFVVPSPGDPRPEPAELRVWLASRLPEAMVPSLFEFLEELPSTHAGKLDRRALEVREIRRPGSGASRPPAAGIESTLAGIWREVLGLDRDVGAEDDFFRLGGDSILAIRVISRAAAAGIELTPRRLFENPTVERLAAAVEETGSGPLRGAAGAPAGPVPLTPVQRWFFELELDDPQHWNMPVLLEVRRPVPPSRIAGALRRLRARHDALRLRFHRSDDDSWKQRLAGPSEAAPIPLAAVDLGGLPPAAHLRARDRATEQAQAGLDLGRGPFRAVLFTARGDGDDRLLLVLHHLVVDAVSWSVLAEELDRLLQDPDGGGTLPPATLPFARWARLLEERARSPELEAELEWWRAQLAEADGPGGRAPDVALDGPGGEDTEGRAETVRRRLEPEATAVLLDDALLPYQSRPEELVLTALARALRHADGEGSLTVLLEGHGRPDDVDLSRTVGWLTALYPVRLEVPADRGDDPSPSIKAVKERVRSVPGRGLGFGLLRHVRSDLPGARDLAREPLLAFNYLGRLDLAYAGSPLLAPDPRPLSATRSPRARRPIPLEVNAYVRDGRLEVDWRYGPARIRRATVRTLAEAHLTELRRLIDHCTAPGAGGFTPSDFPAAGLDQDALDRLLTRVGGGPGTEP